MNVGVVVRHPNLSYRLFAMRGMLKSSDLNVD